MSLMESENRRRSKLVERKEMMRAGSSGGWVSETKFLEKISKVDGLRYTDEKKRQLKSEMEVWT